MLQNYFKSAWRNLIKTRVFTLLNIIGLSLGMTACVLILHYVFYEKSFDKFHPGGERIYRLRYERTDSDGSAVRFASCCPPAAPLIRERFPEVEKIGRMLESQVSVSTIQNGREIKFMEKRMFFAEPELFQVMQFEFIEGDPLTGLSEPNRTMISLSIARKYFGDENPIGKTLSVDKKVDYQVVGVFADVQSNSHLKFDILLPWKNLEQQYGPDYYEAWGHTGSYTYLKLKPQTDIPAFETKLAALVTEQCPWLVEYKMKIDLVLQPLYDIHLYSHFMQEYEMNGNRDNVTFLSLIAIFIIIMAWVNYINLSTSRAITRAQETGLRKVIGAARWQLIVQFFLETVIINLFAVLFTMILIKIFLPLFNHITGMPMTIPLWSSVWFWQVMVVLFIAGVFLSGLYPVLVLSSYSPLKVMQGRLTHSRGGIFLRKGLVVFQFVMSLILITGTFTVFRQLSYMRTQDPGFNMEQTLVVQAPRVRNETYPVKLQTLKETLLGYPGVKEFCTATEVPGRQIYWDAGAIHRVGEDPSKGKNYQIVGIDYDFIDFFDIELVCGRSLSKEYSTDKMALLLNETGIKWMGFDSPESALNQQVNYWDEIFTIIGVVKDYHQQSFKEAFEPHIFRLMPEGRGVRGCLVAKLTPGNIKQTVDYVKNQYDEFFPGNPFEYFFLDEYYDQQYKSDEMFGTVFGIFAALAMLITALGLLGLSAFNAAQRNREIGIRKVLGADAHLIFILLVKEFVLLLGLAFVIACPLLIYGLKGWLNGFAARIAVSGMLFLIPALSILVFTLLTISIQTAKSALTNPIEAIKYE
ncbi:MAG TPA: ABC transporter permease [bacterium]|nr:ABC transporter permease [bacterium]HPN45881.1 ABC transporter permease [bacterium]